MSGDGTKPTLLRQDEVLAVVEKWLRGGFPVRFPQTNGDVLLEVLSALPPASPAEVERLWSALDSYRTAHDEMSETDLRHMLIPEAANLICLLRASNSLSPAPENKQ